MQLEVAPFVWIDCLDSYVEPCQYGLRCRGRRGQVFEVHTIRRVAVKPPVRSSLVVARHRYRSTPRWTSLTPS